jgi:membrane-bound metal-dependent hydrolase YbcI (DUF457 family)
MSFGALSFALLAGPVAAATGVVEVTFPWTFVGLAIGAVAGLLPDIDEPGAMLGRGSWVPKWAGGLLRFLGVIISLPFRLMGYVIKGVLGHRGGTHSLAMSFAFTLCFALPITAFFGPEADWVLWTIWVGFLSHLIADSLNPSGVPWLWPLFGKRRCFHLLPKALRVPTQSPPNAREQIIKASAIAVTSLIVIVFFILAPVQQML